jgi:hypothetical protein
MFSLSPTMTQYMRPATFLHATDVDAILARNWAVDCLDMKLMTQGTDEVRHAGAGCIRHGRDGRLEYVIYDTARSADFRRLFGGGLQPGDALGPEHFFTLIATAVDGRTWTADWLDAASDSRSGVAGVVVRGTVRLLTCRGAVESPVNGATLHALGSFDIPSNVVTETTTAVQGRRPLTAWRRNVWRLNTVMGEIDIADQETHIQVRLSGGERELRKDMAVRLEEAISFILGTHIRWTIEQSVSVGETKVVIRSDLPTPKHPRLGPPVIATREAEALFHAERLFDHFLNYTASTAPAASDKYHPLAVSLLTVLRASASVIEDEALMLSVEVEGITNKFLKKAVEANAKLVTQVDEALRHLRSWSADEGIRNRVLGAVARVKALDAPGVLKALAEDDCIELRHWESWRALRNRAAHGARAWDDVHELRRQCDIVHQLLLLLVFQVVGYTGQFTDYTTRDWPLKQTPRSATKVSPQAESSPATSDESTESPPSD